MSVPSLSNAILASLPAADFEAVEPHLSPCLLHVGQKLYNKGDITDLVYFPKNGVISLVLPSNSGVDVEVGLIGRESLLGSVEALANLPMTVNVTVQIAGSGWRMSAERLREQCQRSGTLPTAILRASYALTHQTAQCVLCNRLHPLDQRLSRWLLMCHDRMHIDTLELTHEFISNMLGTRRASVTIAAGELREAGLIDYKRGVLTVCDRAGLEARACECYAAIRKSYDALTPKT